MKTPTIKFRGVSLHTEFEVFGDLITTKNFEHHVAISHEPPFIITEEGSIHSVHPESVAQYIGLNDKNGKEIYGSVYIDGKLTKGGDVAELDGEIYTVEFEDGAFGLKEPGQKLRGLFHYYNFCRVDHSNYVPEVLGSQFLNPELVKG